MLYIKYTLIKNKLKKKISSNFFLASVFSKEECTSLSIVFHLWVMYHFLLATFKIFFFFFGLAFSFKKFDQDLSWCEFPVLVFLIWGLTQLLESVDLCLLANLESLSTFNLYLPSLLLLGF